MPTSGLQSLLSGAPLPDPPNLLRLEGPPAFREQELFNRKLLDYIRRLVQVVTGPNIVNELIVQQIVTNILNNVLTTKGDLMTRTATTVTRLGVGTDGQVLTADSAEAKGIKWADAAVGGGGEVSYLIKETPSDSLNFTESTGGSYQSFATSGTITAEALNTLGNVINLFAWGQITWNSAPVPLALFRAFFEFSDVSKPIGPYIAHVIPSETANKVHWRLEGKLIVTSASTSIGALRATCKFSVASDDGTDVNIGGQAAQFRQETSEVTGLNTSLDHELYIRCSVQANDISSDYDADFELHGLLATFETEAAPSLVEPGGLVWSEHEADLGNTPVSSGRFVITDANITTLSKVVVWQAPGPYTGKGTLADEAAMDPIVAVAIPGSGSAEVIWQTVPAYGIAVIPPGAGRTNLLAPPQDDPQSRIIAVRRGFVKGNVKFYYMVG